MEQLKSTRQRVNVFFSCEDGIDISSRFSWTGFWHIFFFGQSDINCRRCLQLHRRRRQTRAALLSLQVAALRSVVPGSARW
jgi:hypothetical protein